MSTETIAIVYTLIGVIGALAIALILPVVFVLAWWNRRLQDDPMQDPFGDVPQVHR